ncbi:unnamed protein product [Eruca vesicaria subsp. sativa]|uniref:F-box domain-containing protein n=1 Tax=Eruca vesicaria subsp. sativa TaxID=29727 RepID=A0ABC8LW54_ERUVS|nr:unnamed protein product [Eruca vesicaria subsp. sativa]
MERNQDSDANDAAWLDALPEECISIVVSHTSPRDACVVASVSKTMKSAAESDLVWEKFLPAEYLSLVPRSIEFSSKKEMYMSLTDDSVLIDDGKKMFWLEKGSGKKCYMLSAMDLNIIWSDCSVYWQWNTVPESKFEKVAQLRYVYWFEIRSKISCGMLSKGTHYSVYAVVKIESYGSRGLDDTPMEAQVGFVGEEASKTFVLLQPRDTYRRGGYRGCYSSGSGTLMEEVEEERETSESVEEPKQRGDGWNEVKLGSFYISDGGCDDGDEIEFSIVEIKKRNYKSGLILQGIEIRPMI